MANAVTREEVQERLRILNGKAHEAFANYNALLGAIQDCEFWLERLSPKAEEAEQKS